MQSRNSNGYIYIPILMTFVVLFMLFVVALSTMSDKQSGEYTTNRVSAFDLVSKSEYTFVETEGQNGVKYYVVTKNVTQPTTPSTPSQPSDNIGIVVEPAETEPSAPEGDTTATTDTTTAIEAAVTTAANPDSDRKIAYLTFDDGPSENTGKILDILDRYNVKATFFVIYHKNMESSYKAIVERGHTIALHSYTHSYRKIYKSESAYFDDLNKIHDYVQSVTGVDSHMIRFPGGSSNTISNKYHKDIMKTLKKEVVEKGYVYHDWNVDSTDASGNNRAPEKLLANVQSTLTKHRVCNVLMHDTGSSKQTTVEALPSIIEYVRSQGYEMEALTDESPAIQHNW